jgi:hypothetical protein
VALVLENPCGITILPATTTALNHPGWGAPDGPNPPEESTVKQLISYLRENVILDFQGDLTLEMVRDFLREDDSRESRALLTRLVKDQGVNDMLITLADCLLDHVQNAISEDLVRDQLRTYSES